MPSPALAGAIEFKAIRDFSRGKLHHRPSSLSSAMNGVLSSLNSTGESLPVTLPQTTEYARSMSASQEDIVVPGPDS